VAKLADFSISSGKSRSLTEGSNRDACFIGVEWSSRGAQLAAIDQPDDGQGILDEEWEQDVPLGDVRTYVEENPDADVYEVLREFQLGGDAFDAVEQVVENTRHEDGENSDDGDDDPDAGASTTDDGEDGDIEDGGTHSDSEMTANRHTEAKNLAKNTDYNADKICELVNASEDEVRELVAKVRDRAFDADAEDESDDPPAPPEPDDSPITNGDSGGVEFDSGVVAKEDEKAVAYDEAGATTDADVVSFQSPSTEWEWN